MNQVLTITTTFLTPKMKTAKLNITQNSETMKNQLASLPQKVLFIFALMPMFFRLKVPINSSLPSFTYVSEYEGHGLIIPPMIVGI